MKIKRFESYDYNDYIYISNDEEMISWRDICEKFHLTNDEYFKKKI